VEVASQPVQRPPVTQFLLISAKIACPKQNTAPSKNAPAKVFNALTDMAEPPALVRRKTDDSIYAAGCVEVYAPSWATRLEVSFTELD
jgi:hypothetical protein